MDALKRLFLAALGGSTLTYEKAQELVNELVDKGTVTLDQSKALMTDLKRSIDEHRNGNQATTSDQFTALQTEVAGLKAEIDQLTTIVQSLVDQQDHTEE